MDQSTTTISTTWLFSNANQIWSRAFLLVSCLLSVLKVDRATKPARFREDSKWRLKLMVCKLRKLYNFDPSSLIFILSNLLLLNLRYLEAVQGASWDRGTSSLPKKAWIPTWLGNCSQEIQTWLYVFAQKTCKWRTTVYYIYTL